MQPLSRHGATRARAAFVVACAVAAGCGSAQAPPATFAELAATALHSLDPRITLGDWRRSHPGEQVERFGGARSEDVRTWCARASARLVLPGGRAAVRFAYFDAPDPPPGLTLPPDADSAGLAARDCTLTAVWTEMRVADTAAAIAENDSARALVPREYRQVEGPPRPSHFGAFYWHHYGRWTRDSAVAELAADVDSGNTGPRAIALAFLPRSSLSARKRDSERIQSASAIADTAFDPTLGALIRLATTDKDSVESLIALYRRPSSDAHLDALRAWLDRANAGAPDERAAALMMADGIARALPNDSAGAARYAALGASVTSAVLDGVHFAYAHNFLDSAIAVAPESPAGRIARLMQLRAGFSLYGPCSGGSGPFRRVSREGIRFLDGEHDPAVRAEVMRMVADGYADVVALARGAGDEYADTAVYSPDAAEARRQAIFWYRSALALDHTTDEAKSAWRTAWRLLAGLPPLSTRFFCVYD